MAMDEEQGPRRLAGPLHPQTQRLADLNLVPEQAPEVPGDLARRGPVVVVVPVEARQAVPALGECGLELQDRAVALNHALGVLLPQLLGIAEDEQLVARLQVVAERGGICVLAAPKVVRRVADALVVVGEDDYPLAGRVERLLVRSPKRRLEAFPDGLQVLGVEWGGYGTAHGSPPLLIPMRSVNSESKTPVELNRSYTRSQSFQRG
jgi:hypothetical protein